MYDYPFWSPLYLALTITYFLVESVVTFDIRLIQAKRQGEDFGELPAWTGIFIYIGWALFITLAILNWKSALIVFVVKFVLKVLPVLETIGNILMAPFKPKLVDESGPFVLSQSSPAEVDAGHSLHDEEYQHKSARKDRFDTLDEIMAQGPDIFAQDTRQQKIEALKDAISKLKEKRDTSSDA